MYYLERYYLVTYRQRSQNTPVGTQRKPLGAEGAIFGTLPVTFEEAAITFKAETTTFESQMELEAEDEIREVSKLHSQDTYSELYLPASYGQDSDKAKVIAVETERSLASGGHHRQVYDVPMASGSSARVDDVSGALYHDHIRDGGREVGITSSESDLRKRKLSLTSAERPAEEGIDLK